MCNAGCLDRPNDFDSDLMCISNHILYVNHLSFHEFVVWTLLEGGVYESMSTAADSWIDL